MNGYKYDKKVSVEVDKSIVELYIKVTRKQKPANKSTKAWHKVSCFGLITPNLIGQKYLVHCHNYNTNLKETKVVIHLAQQARNGVVEEGLRAL
jgi:hypothetical protein